MLPWDSAAIRDSAASRRAESASTCREHAANVTASRSSAANRTRTSMSAATAVEPTGIPAMPAVDNLGSCWSDRCRPNLRGRTVGPWVDGSTGICSEAGAKTVAGTSAPTGVSLALLFPRVPIVAMLCTARRSGQQQLQFQTWARRTQRGADSGALTDLGRYPTVTRELVHSRLTLPRHRGDTEAT